MTEPLKRGTPGCDPCGCGSIDDGFCILVLDCCGNGQADAVVTITDPDPAPLPPVTTGPDGRACFALAADDYTFHVETETYERDVTLSVPATPSPFEVAHPGCPCATDHWGAGDLTVATPFGDLVLSYVGPHWAGCQEITCDGYGILPITGNPDIATCDDAPAPITVLIGYELRCLGPLTYPGGRVAYPCGRLELSISYYAACGPLNDRTPLEVPACSRDFYPVGNVFGKTKYSTIDVGLLDCRVSPSLEWHFDFSIFGESADGTVRLGDTPWISATGNYSVLSDPATVCVVVRTCPDPAGAVVVGATVEIEGGTPSSGTTDSEGRFCAEVDQAGPATVTVTNGECSDEFTIEVPVCGDPDEAVFILCCATLCLVLYEDGTDPLEPIVNAEVDLGPLGVYPTDAEGKVCIELTAEQMDLLAPGPTCVDRVIEDVRITRAATETETELLERCVTLTAACGVDQTGDPQPVLAAFIPDGYQRGGCCPDAGCTSIIVGRGLVPEQPDTVVEIVRKDGGGSVIDTFRYEGTPTLDLAAFDADDVTTYDSGCQVPTIAPGYDNGIDPEPVPYLSCRVLIELCRDNDDPGRIRVRIHRSADCDGGLGWDETLDPGDLEYTIDLAATRLCYGDEIAETGTIGGDNDTWQVSMVPP
jgi:hypothetical protein